MPHPQQCWLNPPQALLQDETTPNGLCSARCIIRTREHGLATWKGLHSHTTPCPSLRSGPHSPVWNSPTFPHELLHGPTNLLVREAHVCLTRVPSYCSFSGYQHPVQKISRALSLCASRWKTFSSYQSILLPPFESWGACLLNVPRSEQALKHESSVSGA